MQELYEHFWIFRSMKQYQHGQKLDHPVGPEHLDYHNLAR
jgi:hypothetical protein